MGFLNYLKNKGTKFTVIFVIIFALATIFSTVTLAGYIYRALLNAYLATAMEDFYFTSDLLTADEIVPTYQITHDWQTSGEAAISFELRNYEDPLNVSKRNIAYTAKAETTGGTAAGSPAVGTIQTGTGGVKKNVPITFYITNPVINPDPQDPFEPLEVMVTATATAPYTKMLRGKFLIIPPISYQIDGNAGSPVAALMITLAPGMEPTRDVTITWGEGAAPDMTNPIIIAAMTAMNEGNGEGAIDLTGDENGNKSLTVPLNTAAVYELVFFKDDAEAESVEYRDITVQGAA